MNTAAGAVLFYDGVCALCNGAVRYVLAHDREGAIRFAPLQGPTAAAALAAHPGARDADSLVLLLPDGTVLLRSDAVIWLLRALGRSRTAAALALAPREARDLAYRLVARVRYRLFGRYDACPLPPPDARSRFLP